MDVEPLSTETIDSVVREYANMVYRLAFAQVRSRSDADDIFQEVFLRYVRNALVFQSEEHRKAWLIRVTINCAKKHWASLWRRRTEPSICSPVKGLEVTAMGFVDGKLHIQMATAEKQTLDNHGYFYLIDQVGNRVNDDYSVSFAEGLDSAVRADYQEFVFAVSREQIENYTLYGSFYTSGINTKGNWRITFPLQ